MVGIKTSNRRIKLLEPTDKGREELKEYGLSKSLRHGGVEHLYWMRQVKKRLEGNGYDVEEEFPIGNGETVDLAIIGKSEKIAIRGRNRKVLCYPEYPEMSGRWI